MGIGSVNYGGGNAFPWGPPQPDLAMNVNALMGILGAARQGADQRANSQALSRLSQATNADEMRSTIGQLEQERAARPWYQSFNPLAPTGTASPAEQSAIGGLMKYSLRDPLDDQYRQAQIAALNNKYDPDANPYLASQIMAMEQLARQRGAKTSELEAMTPIKAEEAGARTRYYDARTDQTYELTPVKKAQAEAQTGLANERAETDAQMRPGKVAGQDLTNQERQSRMELHNAQIDKIRSDIANAGKGKPMTPAQVNSAKLRIVGLKTSVIDKQLWAKPGTPQYDDLQKQLDQLDELEGQLTTAPAPAQASGQWKPDASGVYQAANYDEALKMNQSGIPADKIFYPE